MKKLIHITKESGIPLIGLLQVGLIDRGTNLIQVRPTTVCNLSCIFCSTDAGPNSKVHNINYEVELDYLVEWLQEVVKFKGEGVEANIDSVGEVMTYPKIINLVSKISEIKGVSKISMQTNGNLLTKEKVDALEKAGLNHINLSINALDKELAKKLSGTLSYDLDSIIEIARYISKSKIDLLIAPVWIPKINDEEIVKLIKFAKELNCRIGIQKYEVYRYSRKAKGAKKINWWKFYKQLSEWEKEIGVKLKIGPSDFSIEKRKRLPKTFNKNDKVMVEIRAEGWLRDEMIGVADNRGVTIVNCKANIGDKIRVKILEDKNNLYIAEP